MITIEPTNATLEGVTSGRKYTKFNENPAKYFFVEGALIYAKNGYLWAIKDISKGDFTPVQISSEDAASGLCSSFLSPQLNINDSYYVYNYPGSDGACSPSYFTQDLANNGVWLPDVIDDIYKWIPFIADSSFVPATGAQDFSNYNNPVTSIVFTKKNEQTRGEDVTGVLALDNTNNLLWFDGQNFTVPAFTVANSVASFYPFRIQDKNSNYILINDSLYLYTAGNASLGDSVYTFSSSPLLLLENVNYPLIYYIVDQQRIYRFDTTTDTSPRLLTENNAVSLHFRFLRETENYVFLYSISDPENFIVYSINKDDNEMDEIATVPKNSQYSTYLKVYESGELLYYYDHAKLATNIVSSDGNIINSFPGYKILGIIGNPVVLPASHSADYLLLGKLVGENSTEIHLLNMNTNNLESRLGQTSDAIMQSSIATLNYNSRIVFKAMGLNSQEIFFANLSIENSLLQLTDNSIDERVISIGWVPY
jgi:hypothetical protein